MICEVCFACSSESGKRSGWDFTEVNFQFSARHCPTWGLLSMPSSSFYVPVNKYPWKFLGSGALRGELKESRNFGGMNFGCCYLAEFLFPCILYRKDLERWWERRKTQGTTGCSAWPIPIFLEVTSSHMKHQGGFAKGRLYLTNLICLRGWECGWIMDVYLAFSKTFARIFYNILKLVRHRLDIELQIVWDDQQGRVQPVAG